MGTALLDEIIVTFGRETQRPAEPRLGTSPLLVALGKAGTAHVYADTADREELGRVLAAPDGGILREVDGNTVNQPLARKVLERYLADPRLASCARELRARGLRGESLAAHLYAVVCGWIGGEIVRGFAAGRPWEVSLQLHMGACRDPETAKALGRALRRMVPSCIVKVPFMPHAPHSLLIARDLEDEGIPVNFTSTFSARQAVAAALLADVTRTNIFMGRLNQGLRAALLGEHVTLEAQRHLRRLRREGRAKTQLIVASLRDWQTFATVAGADVFTAPPAALEGFLRQTEVGPEALRSQLETSYEDRLGIPDEVLATVGPARVGRLWRVEPELIEFLGALSASAEYRGLRDGERLWRRFDQAGFGDLFQAPDPAEWAALRRDKLPDLAAERTRRLPLDTHYTLLAHADFENHQDAMDAALLRAARE